MSSRPYFGMAISGNHSMKEPFEFIAIFIALPLLEPSPFSLFSPLNHDVQKGD